VLVLLGNYTITDQSPHVSEAEHSIYKNETKDVDLEAGEECLEEDDQLHFTS
jgi:hypothetical protein